MSAPPPSATIWPSLEVACLEGRTVDLERVDVGRHGPDLWRAIGSAPDLWAAIPPGPFAGQAEFEAWLGDRAANVAHHLFAIIDKSGAGPMAAGLFFLLQNDLQMGRTEIGLVYGPRLSRRVGGTEGFFLLARHVFETCGFRRLEWRCNPDNTASRRAAERFGFTLEGVLRENLWLKGEAWDTAVYSLLDREWPATAVSITAWLEPSNFTAEGLQIQALGAHCAQGAPAS